MPFENQFVLYMAKKSTFYILNSLVIEQNKILSVDFFTHDEDNKHEHVDV